MLLTCGKPLFLLLVVTLVSVECYTRSNPMARINLKSKVRGFYDQTDSGRIFRSFTGIPYAKPPIGNLRFKPPEPSSGWIGIYNATHDPPECLQRDIYFSQEPFIGQEDCLYLNVFTPPLSRKYRSYFPVMVFIHGPTYFSGSSTQFRPHRFLNQDVVLVTFNYRLGPLGFLSTEDETVTGNWGLLDQVAALQWIQQHISVFGGNPNRVTLFGQGAGAHSLSLHLFSPQSQGLFHAAIIQSDSFMCQSKSVNNHLTAARLLARRVNCPYDVIDDMIDCLRKRDAETLFDGPDLYLQDWIPRIDSESESPFLINDPKNTIVTSGPVNQVPVIIGTPQAFTLAHGSDSLFGRTGKATSDEDVENEKSLLYEFVEFVLFSTRRLPDDKEKSVQFVDAIIDEYFNNTDKNDVPRKLAQLLADANHNPCLYETARLLSNYTSIWFYSFEYVGNFSFIDANNMPPAAVFWDDLLYLFKIKNFETLVPRDETVSSNLIELWTNFARYETPTPLDNYLNIYWNRVIPDNTALPYLRIRQHMSNEPDFHHSRMHFWLESVPALLNEQNSI